MYTYNCVRRVLWIYICTYVGRIKNMCNCRKRLDDFPPIQNSPVSYSHSKFSRVVRSSSIFWVVRNNNHNNPHNCHLNCRRYRYHLPSTIDYWDWGQPNLYSGQICFIIPKRLLNLNDIELFLAFLGDTWHFPYFPPYWWPWGCCCPPRSSNSCPRLAHGQILQGEMHKKKLTIFGLPFVEKTNKTTDCLANQHGWLLKFPGFL